MKDGTIELELAGEKYSFRLGMGELRELQQKCTDICPISQVIIAKGFPPEILNRLRTSGWSVDDVLWTIKLGLIGGGMDSDKANHLIAKQVEPKLSECVVVAMFVLMKALDCDFALPSQNDEQDKTPKKEEAAIEPLG